MPESSRKKSCCFFRIKFWHSENNTYFCIPKNLKDRHNEKNISTIEKKAR